MQNDMQSDRELDRIIDAALPGYSLAEPRPGLEHRILQQLIQERCILQQRMLVGARMDRAPLRRLLWSLVAVPAIACLLLIYLKTPKGPHPNTESVAVNVPAPTPPRRLATAAPPTKIQPKQLAEHPRKPSAAAVSLPKLDVFPTPSPLIAEERALIALSRSQVPIPSQTEAAEVKIAPIHIAELQIEPVAVPPLASAIDPAESTEPKQRNQQP